MSSIPQRIAQFYFDEEFTDFRITFQDDAGESSPNAIHLHKIFISIFSSFFHTLFKYNKSINTYRFPIHLPQDPDLVRLLFDWIYCPESVCIDEDNAMDLFMCADYFGMQVLAQRCTSVLAEELCSPDNCVFLLQFAWHFPLLEKELVLFAAANFNAVVASSDDGKLYSLPFGTFRSIVSHEELVPDREMSVWLAIASWVRQCPSNATHLPQLFQAVRHGLLSHSDCLKIREDIDSIDKAYLYLVEEAMPLQQWKHSLDSLPAPSDTRAKAIRPRLPKSCLLAAGGWTAATPSTEMDLYDPHNDVWYRLPLSLPAVRAYHGLVETGRKLYVLGGYDGQERLARLSCFDLDSLQWTELAPMHYPRCFVSVVAVDSCIYVMGGHDGGLDENRRSAACEKYDTEENQWTIQDAMIRARSDAGAALATTSEGKQQIWLVGGFNGMHYLRAVDMFDVAKGRWCPKPFLKRARGGVGCAVLGNRLYAIGGSDGVARLREVEYLDLGDIRSGWKSAAPMINGRSNFGICSANGRIFVCGGYIDPTTTNMCEWFDGEHWHRSESIGRNVSALTFTPISNSRTLSGCIQEDEILDFIAKKRNARQKYLGSIEGEQQDSVDIEADDIENERYDNRPPPDSRLFDDYILP